MKVKLTKDLTASYTLFSHEGSTTSPLLYDFRYSEENISQADEYEELHAIEEVDPQTKLIKTFFVDLLKRCLYQFCILRHMYTPLAQPAVMKYLKYKTINERFADASANYKDMRVDYSYTDADKLQKEISVVIFLLETLIDEAHKWGTYTIFEEKIQILLNMKKDEENLMNQMHEDRDTLTHLRTSIVRERQTNIATEKMYHEALTDGLKIYQDTSAYAAAEIKYINDWENSRYEQNQLRLDRKENIYKNTAFDMQWKTEQEEICHQQFEEFAALSKRECLNEIQNWMERYETELDKKDIEIFDMQLDIEKLKEKHEKMQLEYETRAQKMEKWLEYKRMKKERLVLEALRLRAATKIQAWWRGIMFKRKLGPYAPKKGKKGKGKNKGKTKKSNR